MLALSHVVVAQEGGPDASAATWGIVKAFQELRDVQFYQVRMPL
jgi:hypothetical protein